MPVYPPWPFGKVLLCIHKSDLEGGQDDKSPRGLANDEDDEDHQLADWLAGFRKRLANEISDKRIKEIEYIASYSWLQGHKPKVIIPGMHSP